MGADVVIAVELRLPPGDRAQLETLTGVLSRAVDVMITQNERRSLALAQATVSVNMSGFGLSDYGRVEELAQLGYKSAARQSAVLLPYAIQDPAQWQQYLADREARKHPQPTTVETIEVKGADDDTDQRLQHRLSKALGGPLNLDKFDTQLTSASRERGSSIVWATRDSRRMEFRGCGSRRTRNPTARRLWIWQSTWKILGSPRSISRLVRA